MRSIIDALSRAKPYLRERYHVREIGVFGSYVRNEQGTESDLDIPVELDEPLGWDVVDLKDDLERILGLPVDLALLGGCPAAAAHAGCRRGGGVCPGATGLC
ncbi:MAG: nucleotidyltransferase family protein [Methanoculleus sp.]|uniref:nucleotidyltransferase family protein n=1 Tax=Methanoculleus nereidis TaxID=2735141 RepID=UPI0029421804|nr:nucleotidyltransferase family protein [Methanoculleus sp. YWC-01]MCK9297584.1 nucleotidyltransferase family protein [Methanoculleus sp.]